VVPAILTTPRLVIRGLTLEDAPFIVALLNDPDFIRCIGDRRVRSIADAHAYLSAGPLASYARHAFGLCAVALAAGEPIGLCGLLQRDELPAPDLGFAFLPQYRSQGYAFEAASAVKADAHARLGVETLHAIVSAGNEPSVRLLEKLGFTRAGTIRLKSDGAELQHFAAAVR